MSSLRRAPWLLQALANLPLDDEAVEAVVRAAPGPLPVDVELLRRANRAARVLSSLQRPELPTELEEPSFLEDIVASAADDVDGRLSAVLASALTPVRAPAPLRARGALDEIYESAVERSGDRLRSTAAGDAIAEGFAPRRAPADVDWAESALEDIEKLGVGRVGDPAGSRLVFGDPSRTPGWLWARIRGDVRQRVLVLRRRRILWRASLLAAAVIVSSLLWIRLQDRASPGDVPTIVFHRVDAPLSDQFSTTAVVRRVRDGR